MIGRGQRLFVRPDPAGNSVSGDCQRQNDGHRRVHRADHAVLEGAGFGAEGKPDFFLAERGEPSTPVHVAFRSSNRATVDEFHAAAIAAGGKDNGPPGIRRVYHEYYYGAYVLDHEGNNIEAVTHEPE